MSGNHFNKNVIPYIFSGFLRDLAYLKFSLNILLSSMNDFDDSNLLEKEVDEVVNELFHDYKKIVRTLNKKQNLKLESNQKKLMDYFVKIVSAFQEEKILLSDIFSAYVLKYRFYMFTRRSYNSTLKKIITRDRLNLIIKNISSIIEFDKKNFDIEIGLSKNMSKYFQ